jgi:hypothetical protein
LRKHDFNLNKISREHINHHTDNTNIREELKKWFGELKEKMKSEGVMDTGHINETREIIGRLSALNVELIRSDQNYRKIYDQAKLLIIKEMSNMNGTASDPIQVCLNTVYTFKMDQNNGQGLDEDKSNTLTAFSEVLGYLSHKMAQRNSN